MGRAWSRCPNPEEGNHHATGSQVHHQREDSLKANKPTSPLNSLLFLLIRELMSYHGSILDMVLLKN